MQKSISICTKFLCFVLITGLLYAQGSLDKTGQQWTPLEWSIVNSTYNGNPFDLIATVTFVHSQSGETRKTEMFYAGGNTWKFRFTGTLQGAWTVTTASNDTELNGKTGSILINSDQGAVGFVTNIGNKWARSGTQKAFVPQFVMYSTPSEYYNNPAKIDADIQTFFIEHGFNGFHTSVRLSWFNLDAENNADIDIPIPDFRTFEALELLITKVYAAGGIVHIWAWGDDERGWTPTKWGINGSEDKRLQRYIGARLGPLPGWTMSYGFDLFEWTNEAQLTEWHGYMQAHMGWPHYLGARSGKNSLGQISENMDYSSYEQHKPDYNKYIETIEMRPSKPSFSEDRFRVRNEGRPKDYNMEETRRGLWHSTMAGGIANIWGNLIDSNGYYSASYPNPEQIKAYSRFFRNRFLGNMVRDNDITNGFCLKHPTNMHYVFYKENTASVYMELSGMVGTQPAVAIDTKKSYQEIVLGEFNPEDNTWNAPYTSDWAIAVGDFSNDDSTPDAVAPVPPDGVRIINVD